MPRFFVDEPQAPNRQVFLESGDARHAMQVLRLGLHDRIIIVSAGAAWEAEITQVARGAVTARILSERIEGAAELPVAITVLQAIVKGTKFDEVVEKAVELGAGAIIPVACERSYASVGPNQLARWRRIARAAAAQSRRRLVPLVGEPITWTAAMADAKLRPCIVAYEGASAGSLASALKRLEPKQFLAVAVGPEGSFTKAELAAADGAGCVRAWLGPTILRTESAAAAMIAAVACRMGWW
ncbi:MAG: 16S rRNA (uracil(1498)-N(3))-methyltransferase [Candidatus Eremiobacteraeota bacterium]|nr:16S rRNA (uracil(1498)-N(3))-methyltransferase [Candidatus Eremiobacteraeota bacterium]